MKILIEYIDPEIINANDSTPSKIIKSSETIDDKSSSDRNYFRNIANIFNLTAIQKELRSNGIYNIEFLPKKKLKNNLYAMYIRTPYEGKGLGFTKDQKDGAKVALIVDYENNRALAISRSGADKREMLLISEIANKHINEPFKYDKNIKYKI